MGLNNTVLVLLLAGRPQPARMAALHFQPRRIGLVCAKSVRGIELAAQEWLQNNLLGVDLLEPSLVAPESVTDTAAAIRKLLADVPGLTPMVSVTGGALPMTIGAYEVARTMGFPAYYLPTGGRPADNVFMDLTRPETSQPIALKLRVDEYLTIYDQARDTLHRPSQQNTRGDQLEARLHAAAAELMAETSPFFDDFCTNLKMLHGAGREIDFIGVTAGMPIIASCKTGGSAWQKADLDELQGWGERLGGNFCVRLYVTDVFRPDLNDPQRGRRYSQFLEEAKSAKVAIWSPSDANRPSGSLGLRQFLRKEQVDPTYPRR